MQCGKCGAELHDDAVFCDKCGSFVMREIEKTDMELAVNVGKRRRSNNNRFTFWMFFGIIATAAVIVSGVIAIVLGYNSASNHSAQLDERYSPGLYIWSSNEVQSRYLPQNIIK